jgi:hypothetical protein
VEVERWLAVESGYLSTVEPDVTDGAGRLPPTAGQIAEQDEAG